jgi:hypothetical protein
MMSLKLKFVFYFVTKIINLGTYSIRLINYGQVTRERWSVLNEITVSNTLSQGSIRKIWKLMGILRLDLCQAVADGLFAWPS